MRVQEDRLNVRYYSIWWDSMAGNKYFLGYNRYLVIWFSTSCLNYRPVWLKVYVLNIYKLIRMEFVQGIGDMQTFSVAYSIVVSCRPLNLREDFLLSPPLP
jgi:hypothetical protein